MGTINETLRDATVPFYNRYRWASVALPEVVVKRGAATAIAVATTTFTTITEVDRGSTVVGRLIKSTGIRLGFQSTQEDHYHHRFLALWLILP